MFTFLLSLKKPVSNMDSYVCFDFQNQRSSPLMINRSASFSNDMPLMDRSSAQFMRPPSPPILGISGTNSAHNLSIGDNNPQVIYKPNNQEIVYKQNIMVRWLQPPTPPPPAPIIIRGKLFFLLLLKKIIQFE